MISELTPAKEEVLTSHKLGTRIHYDQMSIGNRAIADPGN